MLAGILQTHRMIISSNDISSNRICFKTNRPILILFCWGKSQSQCSTHGLSTIYMLSLPAGDHLLSKVPKFTDSRFGPIRVPLVCLRVGDVKRKKWSDIHVDGLDAVASLFRKGNFVFLDVVTCSIPSLFVLARTQSTQGLGISGTICPTQAFPNTIVY